MNPKLINLMSEYGYKYNSDLKGFEDIDHEENLIYIDLINELINLKKENE